MASSSSDTNVLFSSPEPTQGESFVSRLTARLRQVNRSILELSLAVVVAVLLIVVVVLAAALGYAGQGQSQSEDACESHICLYRSATVLSFMNESLSPCDDFFNYACGNYKRVAPIDASVHERTQMRDLDKRSRDKLETILKSPAKRNEENSFERKVKTIFSNCLNDFELEEERGLVLVAMLNQFYVLRPTEVANSDATTEAVQTFGWGSAAFFEYHVTPNHLDGNKIVISIDSAALGMRDVYYLFGAFKSVKDAYREYVRQVAKLLADDSPTDDVELTGRIETFADDVLMVETQLANFSRQSQLPDKNPLDPANMPTLQELNLRYRALNWEKIFATLFGSSYAPASLKVALQSPQYIEKMSKFIADDLRLLYPSDYKRIISNYAHWRRIQSLVGDLSSAYVHAKRQFESSQSSEYEYETRLDYCYRRTQTLMLRAVNALFVEDHAADNSRQAVDKLFKSLRSDLSNSLSNIDWFDESVKQKAKLKIASLQDRIGYSEREVTNAFLDNFYADFTVEDNDHVADLSISWQTWQNRRIGESLGKRPDLTMWEGATFDYNVHLDNKNAQITIPAGAMQWPLFTKGLPDYVNFATLGHRISAELIKAVDSEGQYYDETGAANGWWNQRTLLNYVNRSRCVSDFFSRQRAGPYGEVQGEQQYVNISTILTSNFRPLVAALDGLRLSFDTLARGSAEKEKPLPLSHLSKRQAFFVSWAQTFCYNREPSYSLIKARLLKHLPEEIIVNAGLSLMPEFAETFSCPSNSKMAANRCPAIFF